MNVEILKESGMIIFETIAGSHAYALNNANSDVDIRGLFRYPLKTTTSLKDYPQEVSLDNQDIKYFELNKFFRLAMECNPNIIELLFMPDDCIKIKTHIMDELLVNRDLFVTKKAFHTFSGYAYAQIKKAKGQNKMVHNPESETPPCKEDFCWVILNKGINIGPFKITFNKNLRVGPYRPIPLKEMPDFDLGSYHVAALEHCPNTFRLYKYGSKSKGVFRGNDMLVCESIPLDDEYSKFEGLLIYNQNEYEKRMKEWKSYWIWMENRNDARWIDQEKGLLNYDQKNMCHCVRLLTMGEEILSSGKVIVRFEGDTLQYLKDIRAGKFEYEEIMSVVDKKMKNLEVLKDQSDLPWGVDVDKVDELYQKLVHM